MVSQRQEMPLALLALANVSEIQLTDSGWHAHRRYGPLRDRLSRLASWYATSQAVQANHTAGEPRLPR